MKQRIFLALALVAVTTAALPALAAGGTKQKTDEAEAASPTEQAKMDYNRGIVARDQAWKLEERLASADADQRAKIEKRIAKNYAAAARHYESAIANNPRFHQAYSSLGYALRKQGEFAEALAAYNKALEIEPTYAEALEYRGEAYLGLDRPEDAKRDYSVLVGRDRSRAAQLLHSMKAWAAARDAAAVAAWVDDELASLGDVAFDANGKGVW